MKKGIHPTYYTDAKVICACGNTWTTGSTKKEIRTDMCSVCHPFFTGEQRIVDTAGQVERFERRLGQARNIEAREAAKDRRKARRRTNEVTLEVVGGEAAPEGEAPAAPAEGKSQATGNEG